MHPILKQLNGENPKEETFDVSDNVNDQAPSINIVDRDRLLFSAFSLLQKLGADERPEVGKHVIFNQLPVFILCKCFLNLAYGFEVMCTFYKSQRM